MSSSNILSIVTFVYGLAGILYIFAWIFKKPGSGKLASWVATLGLIGNTAGILMRWVDSVKDDSPFPVPFLRFPPLSRAFDLPYR